MRKIPALLAALVGLLAAVLVTISPAAAAIPVESKCHQGWYVNDDEGKLAPKQVAAGFMFDGPSLVHRAIATPVGIAATPSNGAFTADVKAGVAPLFKMETTGPYSTINKTTAGKFWSSKIATGPGSQASPVDTLAALAVLAPYTESTKVYSFGVGYANDAGNAALVKSVTFGGATLSLACAPPSASTSASASASAGASAVPATPVPTSTPGAALPITGTNGLALAGLGLGAVLAGVGLYVIARRRRVRFEP